MAPLPSPFVLGEELYLYLAVSPHAISSALIREEDKVQRPVYYISKALRGAEGRYPQIEKLAFALITAFRKLRHYFQAHVINVMTDSPSIYGYRPSAPLNALLVWYIGLCTLSSSPINAKLTACGVTAKYKYNSSPTTDGLSKGAMVRYAFRSSKAF